MLNQDMVKGLRLMHRALFVAEGLLSFYNGKLVLTNENGRVLSHKEVKGKKVRYNEVGGFEDGHLIISRYVILVEQGVPPIEFRVDSLEATSAIYAFIAKVEGKGV